MNARRKVLAACSLALLSTVAVGAPARAADVVALYHMNETSGSTMVDSSGNNNNGTLTNVTLGVPGFSGTGYGYNGVNSSARVPNSPSLNPGSADITLTAHVKFQGPFLDDSYDLVRKGVASTAGGEYKMEILSTGRLNCVFKGDVGVAQVRGTAAHPTLTDNQWHTVRCIKTATTVSAVVDGVAVTATRTAGSITNGASLFVGAKSSSDDVYNGTLDEVSIEFSAAAPPAATCLGQTATIVGTAGADTLTGTSGNDVIAALDGIDTVDGGGGDDLVCGGLKGDRLTGGTGNDRLSGDDGPDTITDTAPSDADTLEGRLGTDTLDAADGDTSDTVTGGGDTDTCIRDTGDVVTSCEL